jgi:histidine triad (HIT) family protein
VIEDGVANDGGEASDEDSASREGGSRADCLFCRIVDGLLPAKVLLRGKSVVAFADVNPQAPFHALVVPVRHVENAATVNAGDGDVLEEMLLVARDVAGSSGLAGGGYRLVMNVGDDAGNTVPHLHLHVLAGRKMGWPPG